MALWRGINGAAMWPKMPSDIFSIPYRLAAISEIENLCGGVMAGRSNQ